MRKEIAEIFEYHLDEVRLSISMHELSALKKDTPQQLMVCRRNSQHQFTVIYTQQMTFSALKLLAPEAQSQPYTLILGQRISAKSAEIFRTLGINFLDQAGNMFMRFDDVLIDIRGRRLAKSPESNEYQTAISSSNLFSEKRSQVIFSLLSWPDLMNSPIRKIAETARVSVGQVQSTLTLLSSAGFIENTLYNEGKRFLLRKNLIDQWVAAYPIGLGTKLKINSFYGDISWMKNSADDEILFSGEWVIPELIRPITLTMYTNQSVAHLALKYRWRTDHKPNIFVRRQFWKHPAEKSDFPVRFETNTVPPLLIYADLLASGEPRQISAAKEFRLQNDQL
ncbi:MAG: type IV toxin-antitoxin system AbiEi family antitoxin [Microbacteriaceae bacterium]